MKDNKLYNSLWYMVGSLSYGFTSLIYLIIITRIIGIEAAGQYSFAFAVAATFYVVGVYIGSAFQVTDISGKFSDTDYLYNRVTSCLIMIVLTLLFSLISGYYGNKLILIMLLVLYRGFDAFLDSFHAIIQKKDKLYKIGMLVFFRTLLLIVTFFISSVIFKDLLVSVISIVVADLVYSLLAEYGVVKSLIAKTKYSNTKNILLFIEGFSVFIFTFLAMYILNSPKYAIDANLTDELQGIFGIIFMPSSFLSLISLYLIHPFLNEMTQNIKNDDKKSQNKLLVKLSGFITVFGIFIILVAYLLGIPVLELLYNIDLKAYRTDLVIIMVGTIFYSLYTLLSTTLLTMRKNIYQVFILLFVSIFSFVICRSLIATYGIRGASYAYLAIMLITVIIYSIVYVFLINKKKGKKKIAIRLMGGLGNQMFQYAMLRTYSLNNKIDGYIDLRGITNKNHNVFGLDHCNISKDIIIVDKYKSIKANINHLLYGLSWVIFKDPEFYKNIQSYINSKGLYCVPAGYIKLEKPEVEDNYMVGYFASQKYIKNYADNIKEELQIKDELTGKNKKVYQDILKENSVCIHIRRGDYIGSNFDVCNPKYYYDSMDYISKKVKNPVYYVFSDDIEWVKNNMTFNSKVVFVDWKNNQYEDLKLMSGCKNFIMSNSTFSFWAQFLSLEKNKVVCAPSRWYRDNKDPEIYDDSWKLIEVSNND